jgi:Spy/CpxP family protein refolding chaperone
LNIHKMNRNQYMLATAILTGGLTFALTGQEQERPGLGQRPGSGGGLGRRNPYEGLGLTEKQQGKITAIQEEQRAETRKLFEELRGAGADRQALNDKMTALRQKYQKKTEAVLTDEQKKKLAEMQAQRPQGGQGGRGQGQRPGGGFGRRNPYADLDLSEEQQKKIDTINQARQEEMRNMIEELRNGGGDREAMMAKFRELGEKYQKQTEAILTDAQKKKMTEMRAQRPQGGQDGRGQEGRGQGEHGNQFAALGVNEAQQKKLDAARQELSTKMRELFTDRNTPREERTPKIEKIRKGYEAKIKEILTKEQYKKYEETRSARGGQGGRRPDGERPQQPRPNRSEA